MLRAPFIVAALDAGVLFCSSMKRSIEAMEQILVMGVEERMTSAFMVKV